MFWKNMAAATTVIAGLSLAAVPVKAAPTVFDLSGTTTGDLGVASLTVGPVTATGWVWGAVSQGTQTPANLYRRNDIPDDRGLGVCSTGENCGNGGDYNELSSLINQEAIRLQKPGGFHWTSLWVSSLDTGGDPGAVEKGRLFWSSTPTGFTLANSVAFAENSGPCASSGAECDIISLLGAAGKNADYLLFMNDGPVGSNNDYLVWKGAIDTGFVELVPPEVPEPASLALLGVGLLGLGMVSRRRA